MGHYYLSPFGYIHQSIPWQKSLLSFYSRAAIFCWEMMTPGVYGLPEGNKVLCMPMGKPGGIRFTTRCLKPGLCCWNSLGGCLPLLPLPSSVILCGDPFTLNWLSQQIKERWYLAFSPTLIDYICRLNRFMTFSWWDGIKSSFRMCVEFILLSSSK